MDVTWKMICVEVMVGQAKGQFRICSGSREISNFEKEDKFGACESLVCLAHLCQWGEFLLVKREMKTLLMHRYSLSYRTVLVVTVVVNGKVRLLKARAALLVYLHCEMAGEKKVLQIYCIYFS